MDAPLPPARHIAARNEISYIRDWHSWSWLKTVHIYHLLIPSAHAERRTRPTDLQQMSNRLADHKKSFLERAVKNTASHSIKLNYALKRSLTRRGKWLFITCMPKSGSTFLARTLAIATGFKEYKLTEDVHKEHDIYLPRLVDAYNMDLVTRQHTKANAINIRRLREFEVRPVILTRNLPDCVVSARDHIAQYGVFAGLSDPDPFQGLSKEQQFHFVIDVILPWYVDFVVGWHSATTAGDISALWLRYEDMLADKPRTVKRILDHFEVTRLEVPVRDAVAAADGGAHTNFNVGKSGRGRRELTEWQMARLERLAKWIPPEVRQLGT